MNFASRFKNLTYKRHEITSAQLLTMVIKNVQSRLFDVCMPKKGKFEAENKQKKTILVMIQFKSETMSSTSFLSQFYFIK